MKHKIFYGWWIVAVGFFFTLYNAVFFGYGWTAFLDPMLATFGWTMAQISLGSSLRSAESGVFNPIWGVVVDRFSPRKLMLSAVLISGAGIFLLSMTKNLAMFYAGFLIMGLGTSLTHLLPMVLLSRWFKRDFGKANGVLAMGTGLGGVLLPLVVMIIDRLSWQKTLLISAIGWTVIGIPLAFVCRNPEPDFGPVNTGTSLEKKTKTQVTGIGLKAALKMRAFWHINLLTFFQVIVTYIPMLYLMPYFTHIGISRTIGSLTVTLYTLISLGGRIPLGWLADRYRSSYLVAIVTTLMGIGIFIFSLINEQSPFSLIILFAVVYGMGMSGFTPLKSTIVREYFGTKNFGTIFGLNSTFATVASVLAPFMVGIIITRYANYKPIWLGLVVFAILGVITMLTIPRPPKKIPDTVQ